MSWTLAPALVQLRQELNARWPGRSKASDGTIGDAAHKSRVSEHNPDEDGVVRAMDVTAAGINVQELLDAAIRDDRVHYVIFNRKIYSRTHGWAPRDYKGASPHTKHVHISLRNRTSEDASRATVERAAADTSPWFGSAPATPPTSTTLKKGSRGPTVARLQEGLVKIFPAYRLHVAPKGKLLAVDGIFGDHTAAWVKEFQRRVGITADGIVGPATRAKLAVYGIKVQ